ncbi:MAG: NUDIX hydrolase [Methanobacteriota archaeon]
MPTNEAGRNARPGPRLAVDAIVVKDDNILLVRRGSPPFQGLHALPGGFVEAGETVEMAVIRELLEETGIIAKVERLFGIYSEPGRDPRGHVVSAVFVMRYESGEARGGDDAESAAWLPLKRLPVEMAFDHARILSDFRPSWC